MSFEPPNRIADRFEVVARLEDRGLGESWHCRDPMRAGGPVTVKLLRPVGPSLPAALDDLFLRTKLTRHAAAFRLYDYGLWGERPFAAFELFEGASLGDGLDRARATGELIPLDLLREAFDGVVAALDAAHRAPRRLLHLGVDPSCVILRRLPGKPLKVKVLDFGLAAWADADPRAPPRSARSLRCAAPESYELPLASPKSDVFSLAALLREMLSTPPETGATLEPAGPERYRTDVAVEVWAEIARATSPSPAQRHDTVRAFAEAVHAALAKPVPVRAQPAVAVVEALRQAPSPLHEALLRHAQASQPEATPPLTGPMPALPGARAPASTLGDTIVLANVAARRAPSPWDLGALRDERAEAEEEGAAGWFRGTSTDDGGTLIAAKPSTSKPEIDATFLAVTTPRKRQWQPVGLAPSSPPPPPVAHDEGDTVVSLNAMPTVRAQPPASPVVAPTVRASAPVVPPLNIDQTVAVSQRREAPPMVTRPPQFASPAAPQAPQVNAPVAPSRRGGGASWLIAAGVILLLVATILALLLSRG